MTVPVESRKGTTWVVSRAAKIHGGSIEYCMIHVLVRAPEAQRLLAPRFSVGKAMAPSA